MDWVQIKYKEIQKYKGTKKYKIDIQKMCRMPFIHVLALNWLRCDSDITGAQLSRAQLSWAQLSGAQFASKPSEWAGWQSPLSEHSEIHPYPLSCQLQGQFLILGAKISESSRLRIWWAQKRNQYWGQGKVARWDMAKKRKERQLKDEKI